MPDPPTVPFSHSHKNFTVSISSFLANSLIEPGGAIEPFPEVVLETPGGGSSQRRASESRVSESTAKTWPEPSPHTARIVAGSKGSEGVDHALVLCEQVRVNWKTA